MKKERSRKHRALRALRILSQAGFFGLFLWLFFSAHFAGQDYIGNVEIFFHFDPLIAAAVAIAARTLLAAFAWAAVTLLVTVLFGRVVCGWVCPLGTVHQAASWLFRVTKLRRPRKPAEGGLAWKYLVLAFVLVSAVFTLDLLGYFDPLTFLTRTLATSTVPAFAQGAQMAIGGAYGAGLGSVGDKLTQVIETMTLNATFRGGFFIGLVFLAFLLLNAWRERFWCRYLCPTGAFLGLASRFNLFKLKVDEQKCIKCNLCSIHCQTQAKPFPIGEWKSSECVYCETCAAICPTKAITFPTRFKPERTPAVDLTKRKLLLASALAFFSVPFFRITQARKRASEKLLRPPGALPEPEFLAKCVKCGECMKACPTNALQPALSEAGPEGLWTPVLVPKIGYCEYYCSLCSQVCPTGAIKELTIPEKTQVKIGTAWINKNRCLPYFLGRPCIVCEEHCPTSPKAIKFIEYESKRPDGTTLIQKAPVIDLEMCIGCGICENKCPVMDDPAIYVTSVGEQRSKENRLLLDI
ncbi:MAG: 4Fe-4S binding protein [Candidatus Aminicenantes bacterium]|nr:4Fe-4S binding protein [Candidatus Aminicenantes bacterium]